MKAPCQCKHCVLLALVFRGPQLVDQAQLAIGTEFSIMNFLQNFLNCIFSFRSGLGFAVGLLCLAVEAVYNEGSVITYLFEPQVKPVNYLLVSLVGLYLRSNVPLLHLMRLQEYTDVNHYLFYIQITEFSRNTSIFHFSPLYMSFFIKSCGMRDYMPQMVIICHYIGLYAVTVTFLLPKFMHRPIVMHTH